MLALTAVSCIYDYNPEITSEEEKVVIEGDILLGEKCSFEARLSQRIDRDYMSAMNLNANFRIEDENGRIWMPSSIYGNRAEFDLTDAPLDRKYRVVANVSVHAPGEVVEPKTYVSPFEAAEPAPELGEITFSADSLKQGKLVLQLNLNAPESSGCYRWDYEEIYRFHSLLSAPSYEYVYPPGIIFSHGHDIAGPFQWWTYTWCWGRKESKRASIAIARSLKEGALKNHEFITYDANDTRFNVGPDGESYFFILLTARTISLECYRYLDALNRGSERNASLLSPVPGRLVGNIRNADDPDDYAIGYVSVTSSASKMFRIDYSTRLRYSNPEQYIFDPLAMLPPSTSAEQMLFNSYLFSAQRPYDSPSRWVPLTCIDCRTAGGTVEIPEIVIPYL